MLPAYLLWLIAGVSCLALEALGVNGIGFLFAGMGALTIGSIITVYPDLSPLQQGVIFLASTSLWAAFLWRPLQRFYGKSSNDGYKNMIGDTVYVGAGGLEKGKVGEVTWSGTIMKAELAPNVGALGAGAAAVIVSVAGNTLMVKPK